MNAKFSIWGYDVTVPDLPDCFSGGDDLDDALTSVQEAIDLWQANQQPRPVVMPLIRG